MKEFRIQSIAIGEWKLDFIFNQHHGIIIFGRYVADTIFIVIDESMDYDTNDVYDISGLGVGPTNKGYLVLCKDRSLYVSSIHGWFMKVWLDLYKRMFKKILNSLHLLNE